MSGGMQMIQQRQQKQLNWGNKAGKERGTFTTTTTISFSNDVCLLFSARPLPLLFAKQPSAKRR